MWFILSLKRFITTVNGTLLVVRITGYENHPSFGSDEANFMFIIKRGKED